MPLPPKELEAHWYGRLREEGFEDIEDVGNPHRPLRRYHSFDLTRECTQERKTRIAAYQQRIDAFFRSHPFEEICALLVQHGNSQITVQQVRRIIELHCEGKPERKIAVELRRSKTCIHKVIIKVRAWMRLV